MNKLTQALKEDELARAAYKQRFRLGSAMHQLALLLSGQDAGFEFSTKDVGGDDMGKVARYLHRMADNGYIENIGRGKWRVV